MVHSSGLLFLLSPCLEGYIVKRDLDRYILDPQPCACGERHIHTQTLCLEIEIEFFTKTFGEYHKEKWMVSRVWSLVAGSVSLFSKVCAG